MHSQGTDKVQISLTFGRILKDNSKERIVEIVGRKYVKCQDRETDAVPLVTC